MENQDNILSDNGFKFLPYNTSMPRMALPEYGRNIQNMVDYCVEIQDKEERTVCAHSIVKVMSTLFPSYIGEKGDMKKFWDHLNIMSHFKLDIDFPYEVMTSEDVNPRPKTIPYGKSPMKFRHYGRSLENLIAIVAEMDEGDERDKLIYEIAHQMKKLLMIHNPEGVSDARILRDLAEYSKGKINLDPEKYILHEFQEIPVGTGKNIKKGKRRRIKK